MTTAYSGDGITFPDNSVQATAPRVGMVNRIINGDMRIDQRNGGASTSVQTSSDYVTCDRWHVAASQNSKFTIGQNLGAVTSAVGFSNYLGASSSSAFSVAASDYFLIGHKIEGFNSADLLWGTANAQSVTLSFKVYSSLTGTFGGSVLNSAQNRSYPFTYTVSSANTWTNISVTIAGDTSGTWIGATNGTGLRFYFSLGAGSSVSGTAGAWGGAFYGSATGAVSVVGTSGATFYVTGVQLEKGSTATDFEYVDYGRQLQQCQRYFYYSQYGGMGAGANSQNLFMMIPLPTVMRTTPDVALKSGVITASDIYASGYATSTATPVVMSTSGTGPVTVTVSIRNGWSPGINTGRPLFFGANTTPAADGAFLISAEL